MTEEEAVVRLALFGHRLLKYGPCCWYIRTNEREQHPIEKAWSEENPYRKFYWDTPQEAAEYVTKYYSERAT